MSHAKLRVSLCQAQQAEKLKALQIVSTRTVDVLAISQARTVLAVLERAFGTSLATACFTAQKNYDCQGGFAIPKPECEEDTPLVAVEDVIQMGINFANHGVRPSFTVALFRAPATLMLIFQVCWFLQNMPACGPVGWMINGDMSVPVCTFSLLLHFPCCPAANGQSGRTPAYLAHQILHDGDGGNGQATGIDAGPAAEDGREAQPQLQAPPRGRVSASSPGLLQNTSHQSSGSIRFCLPLLSLSVVTCLVHFCETLAVDCSWTDKYPNVESRNQRNYFGLYAYAGKHKLHGAVRRPRGAHQV